jgi:uncharacterized protein with HEPN domain
MPRDFSVFLQDALVAIADVTEFIGSMNLEQFRHDKKTLHAVVRNLEVIGEAIKGVPAVVRERYPEIAWQRIAGLRDILIHQYFEIDVEIVWDVVTSKLPPLKQQLQLVLQDLGPGFK